MSGSGFLVRLGRYLEERPGLRRFCERILCPLERISKGLLFGCRMCGQCVLHSTGMVCPMTCPKNLRNGPCGGVRLDGKCEVFPETDCVWVSAYARSKRLFWPHEFHDLRLPVDWSLQGTSSWVNLVTGRDQVVSGCVAEPRTALDVVSSNGHSA